MSKNKEKLSLKPKRKSVLNDGPKTRGWKKGSGASLVITLGDWYGACEAYRNLEIKMTAVEFLTSIRSSHLFSGTKSQKQSFGRTLKEIDNGKLENTDGKRAKDIKLADI